MEENKFLWEENKKLTTELANKEAKVQELEGILDPADGSGTGTPIRVLPVLKQIYKINAYSWALKRNTMDHYKDVLLKQIPDNKRNYYIEVHQINAIIKIADNIFHCMVHLGAPSREEGTLYVISTKGSNTYLTEAEATTALYTQLAKDIKEKEREFLAEDIAAGIVKPDESIVLPE